MIGCCVRADQKPTNDNARKKKQYFLLGMPMQGIPDVPQLYFEPLFRGGIRVFPTIVTCPPGTVQDAITCPNPTFTCPGQAGSGVCRGLI
jgi:hypothetical protein